jgi:hypothetical protein
MKKCANKECNTNIMDTYSHCGRCHRAERNANNKARPAKRKNRTKAAPRGPSRFASDGRVRPNMGLKYCAQLDFERKTKIANALIRWAETINRLQTAKGEAA